ncbi:VAMP-associated protein 33kDa isoform X2 [Megachile rotundata]|uniref:VAMP-associated protein 33kDa isoform X2 n=1 Tax=Megachile rotundata TaxID=143995 RepID=UPI000614FF38|nr:PREDICTED: vesicle-associated membrane protein-associated protein B isoform X2 [Megachile rotundata]
MVKPEQVLIIEPQSELRFRGPFTGSSVTSYIRLTNPSNHKVYFKIKTTAPKRYCVRPNCGAVKPKGVTQIAVTLQPFDFDPAEKNKHKFMVQALIAPKDDDDEDFSDVWKDTHPDLLMESKLKCVFENPVTNTTTAKTTSTTTATMNKTEVTSTNGKNKGVGDSVKLSPKILGETEEKLIKAAQEVNLLRVEESTLRQENLQLKEDLLKLQNATLGNDGTLIAGRAMSPFVPSQSSSQLPSIPLSVLIAIVMAIIGYVLGKMI